MPLLKTKLNYNLTRHHRIKNNLNLISTSAAFWSLLLSPTFTVAQNNNSASSTLIRENKLEEITVTAQRREESLRQVPISIYSYSGETLNAINASDFSDIAAATPGVALAKTGLSGSRYFIRGTGQVTVNQSPTTGVYFDGIPLQVRTSFGVAQLDPVLFDINSIEVLRGPQGSLFGSSSMGGAIRILSNQPNTAQYESLLDMSASSTIDGGINASVSGMTNIPFANQKTAVRILADIDRQDGFIDDIRPTSNDIFENETNPIKDINATDSDMFRVAYLLEPTNDSSITASVFYQNQHSGLQRQGVDLTFPNREKSRSVARYMDTYTDESTVIYSLSANWSFDVFGGIDAVSTTSYLDRKVDSVFDLSPFGNGNIELTFPKPAPYTDRRFVVGLFSNTDIRQISQEVNIISTSNSPFQYQAGLFYKDIKQTSTANRYVLETFDTQVDPIVREATNDFEEKEFALFGEVTYQLTDTIKAGIGGRLFNFEQNEGREQYGVGGRLRGSTDFDFDDSSDQTGFSPRVFLSYTPNTKSHFYLNHAEGFRSGGINAPIVDEVCSPEARVQFGIPAVPPPYESDKVKSTELGTKITFLDNRVSVFASLYNTDWHDYQLSVQQDCGLSGVAVFTANAGDVEIDGYELEVSAQLFNHLHISAGFGRTDATFEGTNNINLQARGIVKGTRLFDVPKNTWNIQADYSAPITNNINAYLFSSVHYVDESESGFGEGESPIRPDYTLINLRLGLSTATWDLSLFIDNLTDESAIYGLEFATSPASTTANNWFSAFVNRPRTTGLNLKVRF